MRTKIIELMKKLWHDPVWSKVIASIIFSIFTFGVIKFLNFQHDKSIEIHDQHLQTLEKNFTEEELSYRNLESGICGKQKDIRH